MSAAALHRGAVALGVFVAALASAAGSGAGTASERGTLPIGDGQGGFHLSHMAGFDKPVYVHGPDGAEELVFVVEREGRIRMIKGSRKLNRTFLDIRDDVGCCAGERGLFSIAFSDWERRRTFYVYYTDGQGDLRIDQFRRSEQSRLRAIESSQRKVLDIRHRAYSNHNGGQLQFGPDDLLYIGTGDGGGFGDPGENAQDKSSLLGKLLRINPKKTRRNPYRIPNDNPYVGRNGRNEIYSRGLRNPWRFSWDDRTVFIADVGQDRREEVNMRSLVNASGANFGWDVFEGTLAYEGGGLRRHDRPIHEYNHDGGRCSITGGYVSRNPNIPSLWGRYLYGDLCTGVLRSFIPDPDGSRDDKALGVDDKPGLTSFGEDDRKRLYVTQHSGGVFRIAEG